MLRTIWFAHLRTNQRRATICLVIKLRLTLCTVHCTVQPWFCHFLDTDTHRPLWTLVSIHLDEDEDKFELLTWGPIKRKSLDLLIKSMLQVSVSQKWGRFSDLFSGKLTIFLTTKVKVHQTLPRAKAEWVTVPGSVDQVAARTEHVLEVGSVFPTSIVAPALQRCYLQDSNTIRKFLPWLTWTARKFSILLQEPYAAM